MTAKVRPSPLMTRTSNAAGPWDESGLRDINEKSFDRQVARFRVSRNHPCRRLAAAQPSQRVKKSCRPGAVIDFDDENPRRLDRNAFGEPGIVTHYPDIVFVCLRAIELHRSTQPRAEELAKGRTAGAGQCESPLLCFVI